MKRKPHDMHRRYLRQAQYAVRGIGAAFITGRTHVDEDDEINILQYYLDGADREPDYD